VAPSRAKGAAKKKAAPKPRTPMMPLIVVPNSPNKAAALEGLERWKSKHATRPPISPSTMFSWTPCAGVRRRGRGIRVNLRNVPEDIVRRRRRPIPTTILRASGGSGRNESSCHPEECSDEGSRRDDNRSFASLRMTNG
jgi:hypothetical protein